MVLELGRKIANPTIPILRSGLDVQFAQWHTQRRCADELDIAGQGLPPRKSPPGFPENRSRNHRGSSGAASLEPPPSRGGFANKLPLADVQDEELQRTRRQSRTGRRQTEGFWRLVWAER